MPGVLLAEDYFESTNRLLGRESCLRGCGYISPMIFLRSNERPTDKSIYLSLVYGPWTIGSYFYLLGHLFPARKFVSVDRMNAAAVVERDAGQRTDSGY